MQYLHKLYFFDPSKSPNKREIYIGESAIDFIAWYKQGATKETGIAEGTLVRMSFGKGETIINHIVEGVPENVNQIAFDGLFFKCTAMHAAEDGAEMKRYSIWINPGNIACMYMMQPYCTEVFFFSGKMILINNSVSELIKNLLEHNKKYKDRRKMAYGKKE